MDISTLASTRVQIAQLGRTSSSTASSLTSAANDRLGRELQSTNVKLSSYGQIKSAFSGAQTASAGLTASATSKTATNADIGKAAQAFVDAYNQARKTVAAATTSTPKQTGALASDSRARSAERDLATSLTAGNSPANLKQAGITVNKDGTLSLDAKALQTALQSNSAQTKSALASVGQQVSGATSRELASTGNVGISVNKLTAQAQKLNTQQAALQQQTASLQSQLEKQNSVLNYATANGIAAYQNLLG